MRLVRCARDERGVTAIEFALVAPLLLLMILGTVEMALDMIVDASVQYAAQQASRAGLTTAVPSSGTRDAQARQIVNNILDPWTKFGGVINIATLSYATYNDIAAGNSQKTMGGLGDVVAYNVSVTIPPFSGIPKLIGITSMTFQRNYIVQNEK
ncbi:TadE/TadG family type IV pilus assembly protein [Caballeronia hypogeia]|uniref:TadE/TadG family type IV pilus assembly protein n=1 Tax=Caballeronia hypogeia TaxID=1777140 RepID=UPI001E33492F|nr:TadE/TadG family type IV pilus assembly protein [Caballeronia hypogeia]